MPKKFKVQATNDILKDLKDKAMSKAEASAETAAGAQAEVAKLDELEGDIQADMKAQYDAGYADGKASVVLPDPNDPGAKYTQAQLDEAIANAKLEAAQDLQPQIDAAVAERDAAVGERDAAMAHAEAIKAKALDAVAQLKAKDDLLADEASAAIQEA